MFDLTMAHPEVHFPIFGICLGMEQLVALTNHEYPLTPCKSFDVSLPLDLEGESWDQSKMAQDMPQEIVEKLQRPVTFNNHK